MLATAVTTVPVGEQWVHEVKWDGMRLLADVGGGAVRLYSRNEHDVSVAFPELHGLGEEFADMLLDGEVVCLRDGVPSFSALADRLHVSDPSRAARLARSSPVTLMTFDLLRLYGVDLTGRPWRERRSTLERLELASPRWQTPPTFSDGPALHAATLEQGLEGVVSKRVDSPYLPGRRSPSWCKLPHRRTLSVVIGGWRPELVAANGSKVGGARLGAVLVGVPGPEGLRYLGRVGSGLAGRAGATLLDDLVGRSATQSPFAGEVPDEDAAGARWVAPALVGDVQFLGLSDQGRLRQSAWKGLRADLSPAELDGQPGRG